MGSDTDMRTLDRSRPFGEVWGESSYRFEQDHLRFRHDGSLHPDDASKLTVGAEVAIDSNEDDAPPTAPAATAPKAPQDPVNEQKEVVVGAVSGPKYDPAELQGAHWRTLKNYLDAEGMVYTNKEEAIELLTTVTL
jgi:hypothetical protein